MNANASHIRRLALTGMMTAVVFASNYAEILLPIPIGGTPRFTLANIACVLAGLLLGPVGGAASGLGSALYDLTFPAYAPECWLTFINKGAMGLVAGLVVLSAVKLGRGRRPEAGCTYPWYLLSAVLGCVAYYALYFAKSIWYNGMLIEGLSFQASLAILPLKAWTSVFNAAVAVIVAPPLAVALHKALGRSGLLPKVA